MEQTCLRSINEDIEMRNRREKKFYVVQFIEFPYEGIDNYICIPVKWVMVGGTRNHKVVVSYPKHEDKFVTRNRVRSEERCNEEWGFFLAKRKYESDTFEDAERWIATQNGDVYTPSTSTSNRACRTETSARPNVVSRRPLPRITIKRPAPDNVKPEHETRGIKQTSKKAAEPTNAPGAQSTNADPECSNRWASLEEEIER